MKDLKEYIFEAYKIKDEQYWKEQDRKYDEQQKKRASVWKDWLDKTWHLFSSYIDKQKYDKPYDDFMKAVKHLIDDSEEFYTIQNDNQKTIPSFSSFAKKDYVDYIWGNIDYTIRNSLKIRMYPELEELLNNDEKSWEFLAQEYKKAVHQKITFPY